MPTTSAFLSFRTRRWVSSVMLPSPQDLDSGLEVERRHVGAQFGTEDQKLRMHSFVEWAHARRVSGTRVAALPCGGDLLWRGGEPFPQLRVDLRVVEQVHVVQAGQCQPMVGVERNMPGPARAGRTV